MTVGGGAQREGGLGLLLTKRDNEGHTVRQGKGEAEGVELGLDGGITVHGCETTVRGAMRIEAAVQLGRVG